MSYSQVEVLLVEDDASDVVLARRFFDGLENGPSLVVVQDGEAALRYLKRESPYEDAPLPSLVLLDLNLPRVSGKEVLAAVRESEELAHLPILVLTTSGSATDVFDCMRLGARAYLEKPLDLHAYRRMLERTLEFWLGTCLLPEPG